MFSGIITAIFALSTLALIGCGGSGDALFAGAEAAVSFILSVGGGILFWCAVMELVEECGLGGRLARGLRPILSRLFPQSSTRPEILNALSQNISANLLGLGNAATPAGIRAAKGMAALGEKAGNELSLLVVINTASIQIIPGTIGALRASCGAASAFDIMPAVWISSALSLTAGLGAAALLRRLWP